MNYECIFNRGVLGSVWLSSKFEFYVYHELNDKIFNLTHIIRLISCARSSHIHTLIQDKVPSTSKKKGSSQTGALEHWSLFEFFLPLLHLLVLYIYPCHSTISHVIGLNNSNKSLFIITCLSTTSARVYMKNACRCSTGLLF